MCCTCTAHSARSPFQNFARKTFMIWSQITKFTSATKNWSYTYSIVGYTSFKANMCGAICNNNNTIVKFPENNPIVNFMLYLFSLVKYGSEIHPVLEIAHFLNEIAHFLNLHCHWSHPCNSCSYVCFTQQQHRMYHFLPPSSWPSALVLEPTHNKPFIDEQAWFVFVLDTLSHTEASAR